MNIVEKRVKKIYILIKYKRYVGGVILKKFKKGYVYISIIFIIVTIISFGKVYAHSVDLDPDSLISFPSMIINGNGTITIKSSVTSYTLYYQWVDISTSVYNQITAVQSEGNAYVSATNAALQTKKDTYTQLKAVYDAEKAINPSSSETAAAYAAYQAAIEDYNNLVGEYNDTIADYQEQIKGLTPMYTSSWIQSTDNKVSRDLSGFTGEKAFVLWAKLVTSGSTVYDERIYVMNGTKQEEDTTYKYADFSNATIKTQFDEFYKPSFFTEVIITGVKNISAKSPFGVHVSNNPNDTPDVNKEEDWNGVAQVEGNNLKIKSVFVSPFFEKSGDVYIWVKEENNGDKRIVLSKVKLQRNTPNGKKLKAFFFADKTSTFLYTDQDINLTTRKVNYKIGIITDQNVIKAMKNGDSNAYSLLLNYAKNDSKSIGSGKVKVGQDVSITGNLNITHDKMYYGYLTMDDENGKYYPVEDVDIYYGVNYDGEKGLFDSSNTNFKWVYNETATTSNSKDTTTSPNKIPKAGVYYSVATGVLILLAISGTAYFKYRKMKDVK